MRLSWATKRDVHVQSNMFMYIYVHTCVPTYVYTCIYSLMPSGCFDLAHNIIFKPYACQPLSNQAQLLCTLDLRLYITHNTPLVVVWSGG